MKNKYSTFVESIIDASSGEKLKLGERNYSNQESIC